MSSVARFFLFLYSLLLAFLSLLHLFVLVIIAHSGVAFSGNLAAVLRRRRADGSSKTSAQRRYNEYTDEDILNLLRSWKASRGGEGGEAQVLSLE